MKLKEMILMLSAISFVPGASLAADAIVTYPAPQGERASEDYTVTVDPQH